ncbi:N4-gp56 family major capsid protein [Cytobacillus kochii]|uniref:phage major capsid protein n=1 Tax=Cytobacillus kochii TaxID=859143 RepID=UPI001CD5A34F|nr:N4-gp56 family major capsid protein [Cytobacillus kochii]MCA1025780.1 N4-gp56 family major capsid protein [Cytobacillus kochii]
MAQTKLTNLINPELFAQAIQAKLGDAIKFTPVAFQQDLEGQAGGTILVPKYEYIGDAEIIGEGVAIDPALLSQTSVDVPVVKAGKAVELTDEALGNSYGDAMGEAEAQITRAVANGVEKEVVKSLANTTLVHDASTVGKVNGDVYLEAMNLFGEDQEGEKFLFVNPKELASIRKDPGYEDGKLFEATVVVSNRVGVKEAFVMKAGAIGLYLKKELEVEADRNILTKSNVISADQHFATHLRDASKVIKVTVTA